MVVVAIIVYIVRYIYTRNWFNVEYLKPENFIHRSKYSVIETEHFPTTYYHKGRIGDVLKGVSSFRFFVADVFNDLFSVSI